MEANVENRELAVQCRVPLSLSPVGDFVGTLVLGFSFVRQKKLMICIDR